MAFAAWAPSLPELLGNFIDFSTYMTADCAQQILHASSDTDRHECMAYIVQLLLVMSVSMALPAGQVGAHSVEEDNSHTLTVSCLSLPNFSRKHVVLHHLLLDSLQRQQLMLTCKTAVIILLSPCGAEWSQVLLHGLPW